MNYQETIDFLFQQLPMFSKTGSDAIKKGLDNIIYLCNQLDNPQHKFKTIHIAGTNGKGSVSNMLAAILFSSVKKTGLYTSPHLIDFRERIRVNGRMIPEQNVIDFVEKIRPSIARIQPSFFEITVAMAYDYFASENVDIAVIETGLGGRLDSTNIIHPILSVITNIGYDHTDLLGNTLELIAEEKAGIIKENTPVVIGQAIPETREVFINKSVKENAPIIFAEEEFQYISHYIKFNKLTVEVSDIATEKHTIHYLDLKGTYQIHNLITVLSAINQLVKKGFNINYPEIFNGLFNTKAFYDFRGRWDIINTNPMMIIDVGLNADDISEIVKQIKETPYNHLHIITGMVKDKDINAVLQLLPKDAEYYFTKAQIPRALNEEILLERAKEYHLSGQSFSTIKFAIKAAIKNALPDDLIIICGSVFIAGEAYQYLKNQ